MGKFRIILLSFVLSLFFANFGKAISLDTIPQKSFSAMSVFPEAQGKYLYRAKIKFGENTYSGMMLIKKSADTSYRIAFVTELGLKIFEMEFFSNKDTSFILHSCISYMNKKVIINTLRKDFESIFITFAAWKKLRLKPHGNQIIMNYRYQGKRIYYCKRPNNIYKIVRKRFGFIKEEIEIENIKNPYPYKIVINHKNKDLSITLTFIK